MGAGRKVVISRCASATESSSMRRSRSCEACAPPPRDPVPDGRWPVGRRAAGRGRDGWRSCFCLSSLIVHAVRTVVAEPPRSPRHRDGRGAPRRVPGRPRQPRRSTTPIRERSVPDARATALPSLELCRLAHGARRARRGGDCAARPRRRCSATLRCQGRPQRSCCLWQPWRRSKLSGQRRRSTPAAARSPGRGRRPGTSPPLREVAAGEGRPSRARSGSRWRRPSPLLDREPRAALIAAPALQRRHAHDHDVLAPRGLRGHPGRRGSGRPEHDRLSVAS